MTAFMSKDEGLMKAAMEGRDIYSSIAAIAFNKTYAECSEFVLDENGQKTDVKNPEGKARRTQAKSIVLGICYGRGIPSIAKQLGTTKEDAQRIYDSVLDMFTGLKVFDTASKDMARTKGYVTTAWGRRRRLPDMQLPTYSLSYTKKRIDATGVSDVTPEDIQFYSNELSKNLNRKDFAALKDFALQHGVIIKDNREAIARATRQCVNARIQGSAADMTKIALRKIANDEQLKSLGFRMLIQVHDEIIGECPYENRKEVAKRFGYVMSNCVSDVIPIPFSTDVEVSYAWYGPTIED